jgi:hypothetical protein
MLRDHPCVIKKGFQPSTSKNTDPKGRKISKCCSKKKTNELHTLLAVHVSSMDMTARCVDFAHAGSCTSARTAHRLF